MLEHVEQLLGELGGEMEAEEEVLGEDFEPCSDEEDNTEDLMEHWPHPLFFFNLCLLFL